jgi:hypothetical protein
LPAVLKQDKSSKRLDCLDYEGIFKGLSIVRGAKRIIHQEEMDVANAKKEGTIQQASPAQHTQSTKPCVPTTILGNPNANLRRKGKNKKQIAFLPTPLDS